METCSKAHSTLPLSKSSLGKQGRQMEEAEDAQPLGTHYTNSLKAVLLPHSDSVLFNQGSRRSFSHKASRCNFL